MSTCQSGDRINNYILQELLGTGSFGQVWKAKHHVFDEVVAIKIPTDPQYVRNLRREGIAIHGLKHPNIVRALDMDPYADPPYLIIEYVDGPTLRQVINAHPDGFPLSALHVVTNIMEGMLTALSAAHQAGVIHRDIKPANILLAIGDRRVNSITPADVRVSDFGLGVVGGLTTASILQSGSLKDDAGNSLSGTIAYMSPEQRDGCEIDHRSDLYATGIILFELLTGMRPQGSDQPTEIREGLPTYLDHIFEKCYTRLNSRYQHAEDILSDLRTLGRSEPRQVLRPQTGSRDQRSTCARCGKNVHPDDQFCIHCGAQLVEKVRRCHSCDAYTHKDDKYCIICGTELGA